MVLALTQGQPADERLQQLWRTLDLVISNTPDFVYMFDLEGRFTYNNQVLGRWQKSLEEAVGKNFFWSLTIRRSCSAC